MEDVSNFLFFGGLLAAILVIVVAWAWCMERLFKRAVNEFWKARHKKDDEDDGEREA